MGASKKDKTTAKTASVASRPPLRSGQTHQTQVHIFLIQNFYTFYPSPNKSVEPH